MGKRWGVKSAIVARIEHLVDLQLPSLRYLTEDELRKLERKLVELTGKEPA